ncbi:small acid-soluble spore protein Tlp [Salibacterium salarium]|uniref:Small acid-soluble spore protein Tlp n=1 Tax=Salibacterium salarium TaxID=284579 RepID=A0A3R9QMN1_9BACI|nr:small acid-soluble spore protein Tlp [Salibacterium salarium]RSL33677.1 small acid-soluble spore protein Tlp [Salibacterium salarium]
MTKSNRRSNFNNKEVVEEIIDDTKENLNATTEFANEHGEALNEKEKQQIEEKNRHRNQSIEEMRQSITKDS